MQKFGGASEVRWQDFVRSCADGVLKGQLTTQHLRPAVDDPELSSMSRFRDFRADLISICEQIRARSTTDESLVQEIDAASTRLKKLMQSRSIRPPMMVDHLEHPEVPPPAQSERAAQSEQTIRQNWAR